MSTLTETYTLSNGVELPKIGLGTWLMDDAEAEQAVRDAIGVGYRNIDTAQAYGNEHGVGKGVRASGVPREDLFVSSKLAAEIKDYDTAVSAIDESLAKLDIGYVDLMLIHAPQPWDDFRGGDYAEGNLAAWRALEEALQAGKVRAIGVSNFLEQDLQNILDGGTVVPHVNQLLVHAGNTPTDLLAFCADKGIQVEAYSPIAHGEVLDNADLKTMAEKYDVSVAQLCIRYTVQLGTASLPKTAKPAHMASNAQVDFIISDDDMTTLHNLHERDYGDSSAFPVYSGK
ncbi:aldo/keto reductase [Curtobacterium pusillum]|uniref:Aldo/keto reductase n=1 Tax=Curtobacterium pusillum TaxID=69373 RepID=A0ABX2MHA6_9MICO|nr:aldo/keto reductase [Curtobacterium pusillum]NUU15101.1 aldo/keto reductase [Curtobacterium pusillum]GLK31572.1 aldo/keto reductase [Curtobacterium pusillum]